MRSEKSIKNVFITWVGLGFVSLGGFIVRVILSHIMGEEYLGLNGLFGNIVSVLSLAELGVGSAITFSLYKPIAENDTEEIMALMQLYRRFYIGVGVFVLVVGSVLTPFLPYLVKDMPSSVEHIYLIYFLYVINSSISYFFSYKIVYISANQNYYLYSINHAFCYIFMYVVQISVLLITRNYVLFYIVQVVVTAIENMSISKIADKRYPILRLKGNYKLSEDVVKTIKTNVFAAIGHSIGNVVLNSTDSIIISKFVGLVETGLYSNYILITSTLNMFFNQAFSAVMSSIGNLGVKGTLKQKEDSFYLVYFANFWIYCFASIAFLVLSTPFVTLVFGERFALSFPIVAIISLNFYATGMRQTCIAFKSAYGIWIQDVHKSYLEAIVNLIISVILVQKFGIFGVLLGTLISNYAVAFLIEPRVLFKYGFKQKCGKYYKVYFLFLMTYMLAAVVTCWCLTLISKIGIAGVLVDIVVICIIPNVVILLIWHKYDFYQQLIRAVIMTAKKRFLKSKE